MVIFGIIVCLADFITFTSSPCPANHLNLSFAATGTTMMRQAIECSGQEPWESLALRQVLQNFQTFCHSMLNLKLA